MPATAFERGRLQDALAARRAELERVAQQDSLCESSVAQRRQEAVGGGGIKSAGTGDA